MHWLDFDTTLYKCAADNTGRKRTFRNVIKSDFGCDHDWYFKYKTRWIKGNSNDIETMIDLRNKEMTKEEKAMMKQTLQCWTPSAVFESKKQGHIKMIHTNPILQLDFDNVQNDIEKVRDEIFALPWVCFVSKSVCGNGLFALILIEEPERLKDYAEHCFNAFKSHGFPIDTTKGRNYTDLRFVSYDANMLFREDPEALKIERFIRKPIQQIKVTYSGPQGLIRWAVFKIANAKPGSRFETVRSVSFLMGRHNTGLAEIIDMINQSANYTGEVAEFTGHAERAFKAGQLKPIYH